MPSEYFLAVRDAVNAEDPVGLLALGAAEDEYDPEVEALARWREEVTAQVVRDVFQEFLGEDGRLTAAVSERIAAAVESARTR